MGSPDVAKREKPLLIFNVSRRGMFPAGFSSLLAEALDAHFISSAELRKQVSQQKVGSGIRPSLLAQYMKMFVEEATGPISAGTNVLTDLNFNSPINRKLGPLTLVKVPGALAVALYGTTPNPTILDRRADEAGGGIEDEETTLRTISRPKVEEKLYVLDVDGSPNDPAELAGAVALRLRRIVS